MMETIFVTKSGSDRRSAPERRKLSAMAGNVIEERHTSSEIIHHAQELLSKQLGLDLCSYVGLEEVDIRTADGDSIGYVDESGKPVDFTEELQLKAAIAVLKSNGHYFEATPLEATSMH